MGVTSIRLHSDIEEPLEQLAKQQDRTKSYIINQAIKQYIAREAMEDERWQDTLEALESIKREGVLEGQQVAHWLNSWGSDNEKNSPAE